MQLRVKGSTADVVARGAGFVELGVTFVVNDDVGAAIALGADGVHLGQDDPGAEGAREHGLMLGRSVGTPEEALAADADYLGAGPVWATPSKTDAARADRRRGSPRDLRRLARAGGRDRRHRRRERR